MRLSVIVPFFLFLSSANAQTANNATLESVDGSTLYRVEEGVFQLREGGVIDLTDRALLMAFRIGRRCPEVLVNGNDACIEVGKRFDLKWRHAPFHLDNLFSDKRRCFLDVVAITSPKGADATATFRLHCL